LQRSPDCSWQHDPHSLSLPPPPATHTQIQIRTFFASPDALHTAFWPQQQQEVEEQQQQQSPARHNNAANGSSSSPPVGSGPGNSTPNGTTSSSNGTPNNALASAPSSSAVAAAGSGRQRQQRQQQQQPSWLQIDAAAVQAVHDHLLPCQHSDDVRDALAAGSRQLLVAISVSARGGQANPGFCRQVRGEQRL
jgi:hypothetical protein